MRVDQVVVAATRGDAITGMALRLRAALSAAIDGDVFALHVAPDIADEVRPLRELSETAGAGPVIYHLSIGCSPVIDALMGSSRPIVVSYHNITSPQFFESIDPAFASMLGQGRAEMYALARHVVLATADSEYNAADLVRAGYSNVHVVPPVVPTDHLVSLDPHEPTHRHLTTVVDGPVLLFVGQLLPHKRIEKLIAAYHVLASYHRPDAKLILVGAARHADYARAIESQIRELNLPVWITGQVSDEELAAYFRRSDLFVTLSDHEGFCFPVVEAFAMGVPVLARRVAALPDTVGNAGLLVSPDDSIETIAEAMAELLSNEELRSTLVERGHARAEHFSPRHSIRRHLELISEVL